MGPALRGCFPRRRSFNHLGTAISTIGRLIGDKADRGHTVMFDDLRVLGVRNVPNGMSVAPERPHAEASLELRAERRHAAVDAEHDLRDQDVRRAFWEGSSDPMRDVEQDPGRVVAVVVGIDRPDGIGRLWDHVNDRSEMLEAFLQKHGIASEHPPTRR